MYAVGTLVSTQVQTTNEKYRNAYEDDDLVDTVDELRREVSLNRTEHKFTSMWSNRSLAHIVKERCTKVTRHDDDGIPEIDNATLTIGKTAIIEDL